MRRALVVGINSYSSAPLYSCVNDALAFGHVIEKNGDGSANFDTKLATEVSTKSELRNLIFDLFKGGSETELLYFAGYGMINDFGGYIVAPDYRGNDVGISLDEILILANYSSSKNKIIILDCCNPGALGLPKISSGLSAQIAEGVSILIASKDVETTHEAKGHGVFTSLLLEGLRGGASDLRGHITPGSMYAYVDQTLEPRSQRPVFKTNICRYTSIRTTVPQIPIQVLRQLTQFFSSPEDKYYLDPCYEPAHVENEMYALREPCIKAKNVDTFKDLQKLQSVGLIIPDEAEHVCLGATHSKACKLTALGYHYWRLVKEHRI